MKFKRIPDTGLPEPRKMYLLVAKIDIGTFKDYITDVYCGWQNNDGSYARWNHTCPPTHYAEFTVELEEN